MFKHSSIQYPIRRTKPKVAGINSGNSKFTQEDIENIYSLLISKPELSMKQIAEKYNVYASTIQNINNGKTYTNNNFSYPLRESKTGKRKLSNEQVIQVINEIKNNLAQITLLCETRLFFCIKGFSILYIIMIDIEASMCDYNDCLLASVGRFIYDIHFVFSQQFKNCILLNNF